MARKKTPEHYYNECKERGYDLPIEDYINNKTKIKHKCSKGHIYKQLPTNHLKGKGCPICKGSFKKTSEQYYNECKEKGYDLPIEDYRGASVKIKHKCSKGHIYEQTPNSHLSGYGCPKCNGTYSYTPEEYYNLCKEKHLDLPIEDYINNKTKIKHKCSRGHIYKQTPSNHLKGHLCFKCSIDSNTLKRTFTTQEYYNKCKEEGFDLPIENYVNNKTKIKHKCSKGHVYTQAPDMHTGTKTQGCPICNESHGEKFIRNYLDKNSIKYESQKTFKDLKDRAYLSYDFYLPDYNILIEYQGIQHYESVKFNGKDATNLDKQKLHDNLKRTYAKDNGYRLLELKYILNTQELVDNFLKRRL